MKTIIIPAQQQATFINLFKLSSSLFQAEPVNCIFVEVGEIPDNDNDLLTIHRSGVIATPFSTAFYKEATALRQQYGSRINFITDYIYGYSAAVFRNYVQHHNANLVMYDKLKWQQSKQKGKLDIFRMVSRSGCELMYVADGLTLLDAPETNNKSKNKSAPTPASILYQFNTITERLDVARNTVYGKPILFKKISSLSRYFLSEQLLQNLLSHSNSSLVLVTK